MTRPSVLIVHNRYQERGGEDSVFEAEAALLEAHGHRVERLLFDNSGLPARPSLRNSLQLGIETIWSRRARARLREAIEAFHPDVAHFHNTFPQVSPAAYAVCRQGGAAVVQTLHNYRLVCPGALLFRDGHVCEDCVGQALPLPALAHACYRGSRLQTGAAVTMLTAHRLLGTWQHDVDLYIAPSAFLKSKLVAGGLPSDRIAIKPNFVGPDPGLKRSAGDYALFAGRLTETKGIETLLEAYAQDATLPPLQIVGDGDMAPLVASAAAQDARITYRGRLDRAAVVEAMAGARCLVFPSVWYENFPVTIVEAFAQGLPVVGSRLGAIPELVDDGRTGLLFEPGSASSLAAVLSRLWQAPDLASSLGSAARNEYLDKYTGERNYEELVTLYEQALARAGVEAALK